MHWATGSARSGSSRAKCGRGRSRGRRVACRLTRTSRTRTERPVKVPEGRAAMATLVATEGSSPRATGSRMWVDEEGRIVGSVTIGGCVDARVIEASAKALEENEPALLSMALGDEDAWAIGMTCAGTIEVLVEPVESSIATALDVAAMEVGEGRAVVIVAP